MSVSRTRRVSGVDPRERGEHVRAPHIEVVVGAMEIVLEPLLRLRRHVECRNGIHAQAFHACNDDDAIMVPREYLPQAKGAPTLPRARAMGASLILWTR